MKPTRKQKVFVSYAREDKEHALRVKDFFEHHGVATWFDQLDSMPGALWREATLTAVRDADYFLALLSQTSVAKKDGFVWREFKLALRKQRAFTDNRKFIFPIQLDALDIPTEFALYHCVQLSDDSLINILEVIETQELPPPEPPTATPPSSSTGISVYPFPWKKIITLLILLAFTLIIIMSALNSFGNTPLIFKATIRDTANNPIQDAYAYILGPNDDTIIKSPPSGTSGQVYFELDTHEISTTVWYYHPQYVKTSQICTLQTNETPRYVNLLPMETSMLRDTPFPALPSPKKLFLLAGLDLTADEKQKVKNSTGFSFSYADEAERILVDYDHEYDESPVKGKFIFTGSEVFIIYNSVKIKTGVYFPPDGGVARTKEDIDRDNTAAFGRLLEVNRNVIVNTLITCLKDF